MNRRSQRALTKGFGNIAATAGMLLTLLFVSGCVQSNESSPRPAANNARVEPQSIEHQVSYPGETLALIAAWYTGKGTNWMAIRDANPSVRPERIALGQRIIIPGHLVTERNPMPRKFVTDNVGKGSRNSSAKTVDDSKSVVDDSKTGPLGQPEEQELNKAVEKREPPKEDDINLDDLLDKTPPAAAHDEVPAAKNPVAVDTPEKAPVPAEQPAVKQDEKPAEKKAPAGGDAEREQLLDELLTQ